MGLNVHCVIGGLRFEWDFGKAMSNLEKHGIYFSQGAGVFRDSHAILLDDPDRFEDEVRFALLGYSMGTTHLSLLSMWSEV